MLTNTDPASSPALCVADDATFWPWHPWTDFSRWPDKDTVCVVVPICGLADWGLDLPLDAEELIAMSVLKEASALPALPQDRLLILPPLRMAIGPADRCAFAVDPELAHEAIAEWCASVMSAGFRKIIIYNSSPWNEELVDAAARDLRIEKGLQMFCINLAALGLDLAPWRAKDFTLVKSVWAEVSGPAGSRPALVAAGQQLSDLLREIDARPPLPNGGRLGTAQPKGQS